MCSKKGDNNGDHITLTLNSDIKATGLAVDCHGKYCLLAGKQHLFVLDITRPTAEVVRKIFRANKLEVSFCEWNPNSSHSEYFIANNNNECQLWKWGASTLTSPVDVFKAHARTITDANWSHQDGNLLATCSIDTFTNLWDIRQTKRSVISFQSVVSAFHVKWNRQNGSLLATAHEGDIRIWDWRNNRSAVHCITGHHNRISDMDWSPACSSSLVSCAHDNVVKVWDISRISRPVERLRSDDPTWKVKFAPYGQAVVTMAMSHLRPIENYLHLRFLTHKHGQHQSVGSDESVIVKSHKQGDMVQALGGHRDVVYDVCWRLDAAAGYQMVSWSRDHTLRIWNIDFDLRKSNDEVNAVVIDSVSPVRKSSSVISESSIVSNSDYNPGSSAHLDVISVTGTEKNNLSYPTTLLHEFQLLNFDIPNVYIDKMDVESRTCHVRAVNGTFLVGLAMHFPDIYPTNVAPSFVLIGETSLDNLQQSRLFKMLHNTALQHVKHNRCCIEPCLRQLVTYLDSLQAESQQSTPDTASDMTGCSRKSSVSTVNRGALSQHFQVVLRARNVPFPRTSGARFCGAGFLVCFTRRIVEVQQEVADDVQQTVSDADLLPTPRAMSALSELTQPAQLHTYSSYSYGSYNSSLVARSLPIDAALPSVSKYYHLKDQVLPTASSSRSTIKVKCNSTGESQSLESHSSRVTNAPPSKQIVTGPVVIYDIFCLLPVSRELAQHYVFDNDHVQMCKRNATVAAMFQRPDLVQAWTVAMLCKERLLADEVATVTNNLPWMEHIFGRTMIKSLFRHYSALQDVQTLAMLSCVFTTKHTASAAGPTKCASGATTSSGSNTGGGGGGGAANESLQSNMDLLIPHESFLSTSLTTVSKFRRSNSWSEAFDDMASNTEPDVTLSSNKSENHSRSVLDAASGQYDVYKKVYASMLFQFGLINQRADLMKHITHSGSQHLSAGLVDITVVCNTCDRSVKPANDSVKCLHCRCPAIKCVVCRLSVRGLYSVCSACLHGGHTAHMSEWFATHAQCPAGCGCQCLHWQRNSFCVDRLAI